MKKIFAALVIAVVSLSFTMGDAEARRMGGGKSFGKQSSSAQRQATNPAPAAAPSAVPGKPAAAGAAGAAAAAKPSMWKGLLGGALLGLGLGALLSHLGIGGALAGMIGTILTFALIAVAGLLIFRLIKRKSAPSTPSYAGAAPQGFRTPEIGSLTEKRAADNDMFSGAAAGGVAGGAAAMSDVPSYGIPADFDVAGFVRNAKTQYIRLQAAWDRADINDIREFTTPEMFAELRMQLQERGDTVNNTDVVSLDAEVLGVETIGDEYLVSVKFQGFIRESEESAPEQFREIWNLSKPVNGQGGWVLAGLQQLA